MDNLLKDDLKNTVNIYKWVETADSNSPETKLHNCEITSGLDWSLGRHALTDCDRMIIVWPK